MYCRVYEDRCLNSIVFQHDGAPPHIHQSVKELLENTFTSARIVSRHFPFSWPPRSPDLTPMDFFFWGYLKNKVYSHTIDNMDELKEAITYTAQHIPRDFFQKVCESVPARLDLVIRENGGHIENFK